MIAIVLYEGVLIERVVVTGFSLGWPSKMMQYFDRKASPGLLSSTQKVSLSNVAVKIFLRSAFSSERFCFIYSR
jgi:hypothetical protein